MSRGSDSDHHWIQPSIVHLMLAPATGPLIEGVYSQAFAQDIPQPGVSTADEFERQMAAMAQDPDVQRELAAIQADFARAEADGLDDTE
jgi:hypothetical protein